MPVPNYQYYKNVFSGSEMPFAFIDLDLLDENIKQIAIRAKNKKIRIASKSVRCTAILKRALESNPQYQGLMTFSARETVWLSRQGFDDLLIGYPCWNGEQIKAICGELQKGKTITLMVDLKEHITHLNEIGKLQNTVIPVCIDVDMTSTYPGIRFGVWRSSVNNAKQALEINKIIKESEFVRLEGLMGYEAAIAGMGDKMKGKALQNLVVRFLKSKSAREVAKRRADCVHALREDGVGFRFVNGGGTGSLEWTTQEEVVTEVTVGSGLYASGLFDSYSNFKHLPAAAYAIEIVRRPKDNIYTAHGGGYIASGAIGVDKQPVPYLPDGIELIPEEGTGEVQTPIINKSKETLHLGDPVFFRHSKAGELCERFNSLYLVADGKISEQVPTYRGEGMCFV